MITTPKSTRIPGNQILTWQQVQGLLANKETLFSGSQLIRQKANIIDTTWAAAKEYYYAHTTAERALIRKTGQQNQIGWWDPATKSITDNPTDARGILICQMYLNQNGMCAYTSTGPYNILDFQVEHIEPNGGDHPDNMILVLYNVNENRKRSSMPTFVDRWYRRAIKGEEEFNKWYKDLQTAAAKGQKIKVDILGMTLDELRIYAPTCPKRYEKYGDPGLAERIFAICRVAADRYVRGFIQNTQYITEVCDAIELSKYIVVGYNREKFTAKVLRNTYSWPHLSNKK